MLVTPMRAPVHFLRVLISVFFIIHGAFSFADDQADLRRNLKTALVSGQSPESISGFSSEQAKDWLTTIEPESLVELGPNQIRTLFPYLSPAEIHSYFFRVTRLYRNEPNGPTRDVLYAHAVSTRDHLVSLALSSSKYSLLGFERKPVRRDGQSSYSLLINKAKWTTRRYGLPIGFAWASDGFWVFLAASDLLSNLPQAQADPFMAAARFAGLYMFGRTFFMMGLYADIGGIYNRLRASPNERHPSLSAALLRSSAYEIGDLPWYLRLRIQAKIIGSLGKGCKRGFGRLSVKRESL